MRQTSKTNVQAQEQYRIYCSHSHNTALYGFQLLYFSSINRDGAAEEWSTEGGPMRRQNSHSAAHVVVHEFIVTASCFYLQIVTVTFLMFSPHIHQKSELSQNVFSILSSFYAMPVKTSV